jgi:glycosyltransferase involved in cell wall biosynthesis
VEAAGIGLPIVATSVGGNPEVLEAQPGVWLIPPDDHRALARAIVEATQLVREARASGRFAHFDRPVLRQRFGLEQHLATLEGSYRRTLRLECDAAMLRGLSSA